MRTTGSVNQPNLKCDVLYSVDAVESTIQRLVRWSLDKLAAQKQDFFAPQYHNIIDPNLTTLLDTTRNVYRWTATDFIIKERTVPKKDSVYALQSCIKRYIGRGLPWHSIQLILTYAGQTLPIGRAHLASPLPNLPLSEHRELAVAIESILSSALPLIAQLHRPALLLPGKLQTVIKAQSIYLHPGEEYTGVWHYDGLNEDIVAVVLYYYRYSPGLEGGDLEFMSKKPRNEEFWLYGDCTPDNFNKPELEEFIAEQPHTRVPMKQGTLVVFSNYQLVHRVLRMVNTSPTSVSRDFLVLFLVDQRSPLPSTHQLPQHIDPQVALSIREKLFFKQLQPSGHFGVYGQDLVYSTGNGSCALLGWMNANQEENIDTEQGFMLRIGLNALDLLSKSPPLNRGRSWIVDKEMWGKDTVRMMELKRFLSRYDQRKAEKMIIKWAKLGPNSYKWSQNLHKISNWPWEMILTEATTLLTAVSLEKNERFSEFETILQDLLSQAETKLQETREEIEFSG